jgi:hypothetical protein
VYQVHGKAIPFTFGAYTAMLLSSAKGPRSPGGLDLKRKVILTKSGLSVYYIYY